MRHFKKCAKGFYMSLGMFSGIPLPFHIWDEKYTAVMIALFPIVGLAIGALWWLAATLMIFLELPLMLIAAFGSLAPFLIAGFIHLDGLMDTSDALLSYRPIKDKLRILKDPHVGAFAVVMLVILLLLQFSAMHAVFESGRYLILLVFISVISRCCSAFSIFTLRHMPESNYAPMLKQNLSKTHKVFVVLVAIAAIGFAFIYAGLFGIFVLLAVILGYALAMKKVFKDFKGISGDLLGYAMVIGELCGLIALAAMQGRWVF